MNNRRKSLRGRDAARWLLPLWGLGAGCFIELPERYTDGGLERPELDALSGIAPGSEPEGPGTKPPPTGGTEADALPPGVGPPPPATQPPSAGPPPTMAPTAPPTDPPPACAPGICHSCNGDMIVPSEFDARCEATDCQAFPLIVPGTDPVSGVDVCNGSASRMPRHCDAQGNCMVASNDTCTEPVGSPLPLLRATPCQHIARCGRDALPLLVNIPAGQACIQQPGACDGFGRCIGGAAPRCEDVPLAQSIAGVQESFCGRSPSDPSRCRFALQLGTLDADPNPNDLVAEASCDHFCRLHGWTCIEVLQSDRWQQCRLCDREVEHCVIDNGCSRTIQADLGDEVDAWNGIICDCRAP